MAITQKQFDAMWKARYEAEATKQGQVRIRQTGYEYVVEEYRFGWHIIEALPSLVSAEIAAREYNCEII